MGAYKNDKDLYSRIKYAWKEIKPKEALKYWEEDTKSAPYNYNSLVDKKNAMLQTIYHEYGHSILGGKVSEYYHTNSEVYEAVKKIERKYKRETSKYKTVMQNARFGWDKYEGMDQDERNKIAKEAEDKLKEVYVSKYANDSTGEFIAECFANACLCSNPSPYSVEVYELLKNILESKGGLSMFRPSERLEPYVDFDNGTLLISEDLPKDLEDEAKEFRKQYEENHRADNLIEY